MKDLGCRVLIKSIHVEKLLQVGECQEMIEIEWIMKDIENYKEYEVDEVEIWNI